MSVPRDLAMGESETAGDATMPDAPACPTRNEIAEVIFEHIAWEEIYRPGDALPDTTPAAEAVLELFNRRGRGS